jgi:hypothetical protein
LPAVDNRSGIVRGIGANTMKRNLGNNYHRLMLTREDLHRSPNCAIEAIHAEAVAQ